MQFAPYKGVKKFTFTITSATPYSNLLTLDNDALVFANVYNTSGIQLGNAGFIQYRTAGTNSFLRATRIIWQAGYNPLETFGGGTEAFFGQRQYPTLVPAGKTVTQGLIWIGGIVVIDLYVLDINDQIVDN